MALDGIFLSHIKNEIQNDILGARVEKIHQPSKEELVISFRSKSSHRKLLISARANSPRVNFTDIQIENPKTPPMFCMLLRKRLSSSRLICVEQYELERVLLFKFETVNELGDFEKLSLAIEIMGKYSNVILINENNMIIDSLKRVNSEMSSKRLVLPGVEYQLPPAQDKLCLLNESTENVVHRIVDSNKQEDLSKRLLSSIQGISPIVCREITFKLIGENRILNTQISELQKEQLKNEIAQIKNVAKLSSGSPYMILDQSSKPIDITFFFPTQYENSTIIKKFNTFSELLDKFYFEKDSCERMKSKSQDLIKKISTIHDRLGRKVAAQHHELIQCSEREKFRVWADVINANLYSLKKGQKVVELENFYDESLSTIKINLDPSLSPIQNAQKYYKKYQKLKTAEYVLKNEIQKASSEIVYLETVLDELSRIKNENELLEIKDELIGQGYLKKQKKFKEKKIKESQFIEETSSSGFKIFIGKNNKQNDRLTLKVADKNDLWFHVKDIPGSHVVVVCDGKQVDDTTIKEAATFAAKHSKASNSSQVPVDYTLIKNVSKPNGAKPGMVIYVKNKTLYVTP